jgi:hypothetical protein
MSGVCYVRSKCDRSRSLVEKYDRNGERDISVGVYEVDGRPRE